MTINTEKSTLYKYKEYTCDKEEERKKDIMYAAKRNRSMEYGLHL